jgi:uncharacterized lipoprotein YddW (UPF0748 family)
MKLKLCILLALILAQTVATRAEDYPKQEIRAVWLSTFYGMDWPSVSAFNSNELEAQQQELCDKLDMLRAANFNMVFLQVRIRGDLIYPSEIEPMNRVFSGKHGGYPGYDPLQFAIQECHRRGLECHAWFITYPLGTDSSVKNKGDRTVVKTNPEMCRLHNGEWYLDPGMPETSDYILSLVKELINSYDLDGIHLDHIRYPERSFNFPDADTHLKYGDSQDINTWRTENVNAMVERIYDWVKQHKPWVQVSSSPMGKHSPLAWMPNAGLTASDVYQDSQEWLRRSKHDMIAPMMYYRDNHFYPFAENWMENTYGRHFAPGLGIYKLSPGEANWKLTDITDQIDYLRSANIKGFSFYRGEQLFNDAKGVYTILKNKYFKYPALLPPLTWLNRKRPPSPINLKVKRINDMLHITWNMPLPTNSDADYMQYTVYCSRTDEVDTNLAQNILATGLQDKELFIYIDTYETFGLLFRVTASNRYHIESRPSSEFYYYLDNY